MITKLDITDRAKQWQLRPDVVEKDYVLGWVLAAIAQHEESSINWVLKGGTCIKKCFIETYRFSEDLDFSLLDDAVYSDADLLEVLRDVAALAGEMSGIQFDPGQIVVNACNDRLGRPTFEARVPYRGPMAIPTWPRLRFDLTRHEPVVDDPVRRAILHGYPDALPREALAQTYSIEELLAEKVRALVERARPRDLWDVVFLVDNAGHVIELDHAREVFVEKCSAKSFGAPTAGAVAARAHGDAELLAEWDSMLAHQLPRLPTISSVLERLPAAIAWIDVPVPATVSTTMPAMPAAITMRAGEDLVAPAGVEYWHDSDVLERIRYAGASRLCVEFLYKGERRTVEPYSLRRARSTGNLLLYAHDLNRNDIRAFKTSDIRDLQVTTRSFTPRHRVEFVATGTIAVGETARSAYTFRQATSRPRPRSYARTGPTYVFQCTHCQKEFRHGRNDATLRRHKFPGGVGYCSGRRGYLVRTT